MDNSNHMEEKRKNTFDILYKKETEEEQKQQILIMP